MFVELTSGVQAANAAIDSAVISPTPNALVLMYVLKWAGNSANPSVPTIVSTGVNLTFELVDSVIVEPAGTSRGLLEMYRAQGDAPIAGVINFDFRADSGGGGMWWIGEDHEVPIGNNGADAVVQVLSDAEDGGGTAFEFGAEDEGVPLATFNAANNKTIMGIVLRGTATYTTTISFDADMTPFTNFVLDDTVDWVMRVAWKRGPNLTPGASWPDSSAATSAIAAEIVERVLATPVNNMLPSIPGIDRRV